MLKKKEKQMIKILWWETETLKLTKWILGILVLVAVLVWTAVAKAPDQYLHIWFLNVGQGDSIYVRAMNGFDLLIDGGPDSKVLSELGEVMPFYDHEINLVIATHPDADHIAGLVEVLKRYQVDKLMLTDVNNDTAVYKELSELIKNKNIIIQYTNVEDINHTNSGSEGKIQLNGDLHLRIFWPLRPYGNRSIENINSTSIVNKLDYKDISFLFTGDAEESTQKEIVQTHGDQLKSDVLKVSHHGSYNASDFEFLLAVNPELAIISVGENNYYGHPHFSVLEKLDKLGIKVLRTDKNGRVEIITDGEYFWTETEK